MKYFLIKVFKFSIIIIVFLYGIQFSVDSFLKSSLVCDPTWSKVFKGEIKSDIVIIGNSRAQFQYNPKIITEITGLACYNLGLSGTPINIFDIRWKAFVNRNKLPAILIIDVDYNFLGSATGIYEKHQYIPYVNEREYEIVASKIDNDLVLDQFVPCFKFRGLATAITAKFSSAFSQNCDNFINGYSINNNSWNDIDWFLFEKHRLHEIADSKKFHDLYEDGFSKLSSILDFSKEKNIKVVLVWSPQYTEVQKFKENQRRYVDSLITDVANKYKLDYLNFSTNDLVNDKSNFYNHSHLNYKGASEFSVQIASYIKNNTSF